MSGLHLLYSTLPDVPSKTEHQSPKEAAELASSKAKVSNCEETTARSTLTWGEDVEEIGNKCVRYSKKVKDREWHCRILVKWNSIVVDSTSQPMTK